MNLSTLLTLISQATEVPEEQIIGNSRKANVCAARHIYCYVARKTDTVFGNQKWTLEEIGTTINRNHATVREACIVVANMLHTRNAPFLNTFDKVLKILTS